MEFWLIASQRLGLYPKECIALEDTKAGVESAKSAGLYCFAIPSEFSKKQDFSMADKIFNNLQQVIQFLKDD